MARVGDADGATQEMRTAMQLDPTDPTVHYNLARLLFSRGGQKAAAEEFAIYARMQESVKAAQTQNTQAAVEIGKGLKALAAGDAQQAIEAFKRAVQAAPQSAEAHNHLGVALDKAGDPEGAITEFRKAISLQLQNAAAYNNVGDLLAKQGNIDAAIDELERAVALKADLAEAHYNLALVLLQKGDRERSRTEFERARELGHAAEPGKH